MIRTLAFVAGCAFVGVFAAFDGGWPVVLCGIVGALSGYLLAQVIDDEAPNSGRSR